MHYSNKNVKNKLIQPPKYAIESNNIIFNTQGVKPVRFTSTTNNTTVHSNNSPSSGHGTFKRKGRKVTSIGSNSNLVKQFVIA